MRQKSREKAELIFRWAAILLLCADLFLQYFLRGLYIGLENKGVSFGWGQEWGSAVSFLAYILVVFWFIYEKWVVRKNNLFVFLMACGGLGNLLGRIWWGGVWDYICVSWLPFCFNLSDCLISLGVVSYILGGDGYRSTVRRQGDSGNK